MSMDTRDYTRGNTYRNASYHFDISNSQTDTIQGNADTGRIAETYATRDDYEPFKHNDESTNSLLDYQNAIADSISWNSPSHTPTLRLRLHFPKEFH